MVGSARRAAAGICGRRRRRTWRRRRKTLRRGGGGGDEWRRSMWPTRGIHACSCRPLSPSSSPACRLTCIDVATAADGAACILDVPYCYIVGVANNLCVANNQRSGGPAPDAQGIAVHGRHALPPWNGRHSGGTSPRTAKLPSLDGNVRRPCHHHRGCFGIRSNLRRRSTRRLGHLHLVPIVPSRDIFGIWRAAPEAWTSGWLWETVEASLWAEARLHF